MNELFAELTAMAGLTEGAMRPAVMAFLRVGAVMALLPAFGEQSVPQRFRLILTLAFTAVVGPAVADRHGDGPILTAAAAEVLAGLLMGLGLRLFVLTLQTAGTIAAQATSLSQLFAGAGVEPQPAVANLFVMAGLALAVHAGLHVHAAQLMILSYDLLPAGRFPNRDDVAGWGTAQVARSFSLAFQLGAPLVIMSLIYNIALGIINRAMPMLMVSFIGAPALALGGLALTALMAPLVLMVWLGAFQGFVAAPFGPAP